MALALDLSGRTALVTGAARGIGREIAHTLRDAGARVVATDADAGGLAQLGPGLDSGAGVVTTVLDVTDPDLVREAVRAVATAISVPDILVNNAGVASRRHGPPFVNQDRSDWARVVDVNLFGTVNVTAEWARVRDPASPAVVVNIASVAGRAPTRTDPAYSAAKAAVLSFTQSCARDLAPAVRVCAVCPGMVFTPFYQAQHDIVARYDQEVAASSPKDFFDRKAAALIPMGTAQTPRDVAQAVAFLASDLACCITGQALHVDGGLVMS